MRISRGVSVAGEVLHTRDYVLLTQTTRCRTCKSTHKLRIITGAPDTNDGIQWVRVDIADGRIIHIDPEKTQGLASSYPCLVGQLRIMCGAQSHWPGDLSDNWGSNAGNLPILLVNTNQQRSLVAGQSSLILQGQCQGLKLCSILVVAREEDNTPNMIFMDQCLDLWARRVTMETNREQLPRWSANVLRWHRSLIPVRLASGGLTWR